jgi:hypothetical protein
MTMTTEEGTDRAFQELTLDYILENGPRPNWAGASAIQLLYAYGATCATRSQDRVAPRRPQPENEAGA